MASASVLKYRRTHNSILISKILSCRENVSPFTLILDSLEQSAKPLISEIISRVRIQKANVIFVSFETLRQPSNIDAFVDGLDLNERALQAQVAKLIQSTNRNILILDNLYHLLSSGTHLPTFFSTLMSPTTAIVSVYHTDMPLPPTSAYLPNSLTLLHYLATSILRVHSFSQILVRKQARDRSQAEPDFGLAENTEGLVMSLEANDPRGLVLEMEYRRKSGRSVKEWFFVPAASGQSSSGGSSSRKPGIPVSAREQVILLEDHPLYATQVVEEQRCEDDGAQTSFNMGLTDKQRRDREGIVLPYFDAQTGAGGEGGRILYDMGVEDDFDDEEDEI